MLSFKRKKSLAQSLLASSALVFSMGVSAIAPESAQPTASNLPLLSTDRLIVKYKDNTTQNEMSTLSTSAMQSTSRIAGVQMNYLRKLATGAHVMKLDNKMSAAQLNKVMGNLMSDPNIEYVEPDRLLKPMATPTDPRYNEQWHYFESTGGLNLPSAWDSSTGQGVVVAVIDTGYRAHADLVDNLLPGYDMISDSNIAQDGGGRDSDARDPGDWAPAGVCDANDPGSNSSWHGTHVAGTVAAATNNGIGIAGVAYNAKIVPIRTLGRCGGYTSDIADSIIWGAGGNVSGVPANQNPADVLNLSLGGGGACGNTTQSAINTARNLGATVVVAAGNSNINASNANPANCNGVVTVASTGRDGGKAYYSNFGNVVDVAAPGGEINVSRSNGVLSTLNSGSRGPGSDNYAFYQGTSMAAPHVAGVAALIYAANPNVTPTQVENILKSTSRSFPSTCSQCGTGIVDAAAAVAAAGGSTPTPTPTPGDSVLQNGTAKTGLSGAASSQTVYTMTVPAGATNLSFAMSGGSGDADMYVRFGSAPTTSAYDCRPYENGNNETCTINNVQAGTYYVMLRGYRAYSGVRLLGSYQASGNGNGGGAGISESNLSGTGGSWQHFSLEVPSGASSLTATMSGGSGDADLYVRRDSQPTSSSYDCRPWRDGNNENCNINNPQAGTWYISIQGYSNFSGVSLEANAN